MSSQPRDPQPDPIFTAYLTHMSHMATIYRDMVTLGAQSLQMTSIQNLNGVNLTSKVDLKLTLEQKCIKKTLKGMTRDNWSPISTSYLNFEVGAQMALERTQSRVFFSIFFIFFSFPTPYVHKMNFLR